jgi:hypothetical protein
MQFVFDCVVCICSYIEHITRKMTSILFLMSILTLSITYAEHVMSRTDIRANVMSRNIGANQILFCSYLLLSTMVILLHMIMF